jgi:hypothetical protein
MDPYNYLCRKTNYDYAVSYAQMRGRISRTSSR